MEGKKVIFLDVDGTLVDYEGNLPKTAAEAVRKARENGHKVYICTGRSKAEIYEDIWDIGLDGMIGGNGSYAEDNGSVVMHKLISADECRKAVDWLNERGLVYYLESNNGLFAGPGFETKAEEALLKYSKRKGYDNTENMTVRQIFPNMIFDGDVYRDDLNKISFVLNTYEDYLEAKDAFPEFNVGTWGGKDEEALFGDFGVKDIDKAEAIKKLLEHIGADIKDTIAFGDAKVDIPMLKYCAFGVAMGNGGAEIKAMADYITGDVEENGLFEAFRHLKLI